MESLLTIAEDARRRGRYGKAIASYRRLLAENPRDGRIHARLAPLLARRGQLQEALASFVAAAAVEEERGFLDKAIGLYQGALRYLPREASLWLAVSELHLRRKRTSDAVRALLAGAARLGRRRDRPEALRLVQRVLELDAVHVEATIVVARLLGKLGRRQEALALLEERAAQVGGRAIRRLRGTMFRVNPTFGNLLRWLRA
jgi:tetratricopeptide (TPR) repeat protein